MPSRRRALALTLVAGMACWSTASFAQTTPAPEAAAPSGSGDTIRLSDEEKRAVLDGITPESAAAARGEAIGSGRIDRGIHGEIGAMIGSNGTRGIYGAAAIPLGDHAGATVSFESSRFGYRRYR